MFHFKEIAYEYRYEPIENKLVRYNKDMMIFQLYNWEDRHWRFDTIASDVAYWTTEHFFRSVSEEQANQIIDEFYKKRG